MKKFLKSLLLALLLVSATVSTQAQSESSNEPEMSVAQNPTVTSVEYVWGAYYGNDVACYNNYGVTWTDLNNWVTFMYMLNMAGGGNGTIPNWFWQQSIYSVPASM